MTKDQPIKAEPAAGGIRKELQGVVTSDRMTKTIVVRCQRQFRHPVYRKVVRTYKKFYAHDEQQQAKKGDTVRIIECRPLSKTKRWYMAEVVKKAGVEKLEPSDVV